MGKATTAFLLPLEGQYTTVVYGLIRQQRYQEAVAIVARERLKFPRSRAALSLMGYCYFHMQVG